MASSCAVIASTEPIANAFLLSDGRGFSVPFGNVEQTSEALLRLVTDAPLCRRMGIVARNYVSSYHNPEQFKCVLLQATGSVWKGERSFTKVLEVEQQHIELNGS